LPGQKAAIFPVDKGQTLEFSIDRKHRPTLKRGGIKETKTLFDMKALAKDADAEIDRVLAMTDANVFKIVTGESESSQGFTRSALKRTLKRWVVKYKKDDPDKDIAKFDKWMYGIKEYPTLKVTKRLATRTAKHEAEVAQRERERLRELAATKRAMTKAEQKSTRLTGRKAYKMMVKTSNDVKYIVTMTAAQRQNLILAILKVDEAVAFDFMTDDEWAVLKDLRESLLNAA
jgi:hypothetical protein